MPDTLWLNPIPPDARDRAVAALDEGDVAGFIWAAGRIYGLALVKYNIGPLKARGVFEQALVQAYSLTPVVDPGSVVLVLRFADRERLFAAGDPLPGPGPFVLYRGVGGRWWARRMRGCSWSASEQTARFFANRATVLKLADPGVYRVTVGAADVLFYLHQSGRGEREFVVNLPKSARPVRVANEPAARVEVAGEEVKGGHVWEN